jgi:hypothetical protein
MGSKKPETDDADQLEIFTFEEKRSSIIKQAYKSFKVALMGTLFIMAEENTISFKMNFISMTIDTLQILSYPFNQDANFPWNPGFSDWFSWLCNFSQMEFYISDIDPLMNLIIYLILILIVFLNLLNAAYVGYRYSHNLVQNVILLKILRSVTSLLTTVLFQPILSQFVFIFACSTGSLDSQGCPAFYPELLLVSSLLTMVIFGLLSFVVAASFYEQDCLSEDVTARPHARLELYYIAAKALLTLQFKIFTAPAYHIYGVISNVFFSLTVCYLYVFYMPFYHYTTTVIQAKFTAIYVWSAFCLAITVIQQNSNDAGPVMIFFLGSICVWILTDSLCDWRAKHLAQKTPETCKNVLEVELATRFKLLTTFKTLKVNAKENEAIINWVEEFYYEAQRKYPNSSMLQLFAAQFYLTYRESVNDAVVKIEKAEQLQPRLDEQFIIYKRKQDFSRSSSSDTITFVTFNSHLQSAHRAEIVALTSQLKFWNELMTSTEPDFELLTLLSANISQNIGDGRQHYDTLMKINSNHPKMLRMHAYFLSDVLNELDQTRNLLNRAQNLDEKKEDNLYTAPAEGEAVDAYFELSIGRSVGEIDKCNQAAINMLKMPKSSLINSRLASFIQPPYDTFFTDAAFELIDAGDGSAPMPPLDSFFLDGTGFVIPVIIRLDLNVDTVPSSRRNTGKSLGSALLTEDRTSIRDSAMNSEVSANSFSSRRPSSRTEGVKAHIACRVTPSVDKDIVLILNQDYRIVRLSRDASSLIGLDPNSIVQPSITEYLFRFSNHIATAKAHAVKQDNGDVQLAPVQTFILTSWGKFARVRLHFEEKIVRRTYCLSLRVTLLPDYSRPTQRFFSLMAEFLRSVLSQKDGVHGLKNLNLMEMLKQDSVKQEGEPTADAVTTLLRRLRVRVKKANEIFSPELRRILNIFKLFSLMIVGLYIGNYVVSDIKFSQYQADIDNLRSATELQTVSLDLAVYTRLLDMERRGIVVIDGLGDKVYAAAENTEVLMNDINGVNVDKLSKRDVYTVSFDQVNDYSVKTRTALEAVTYQAITAQKMTELPVSEINIKENSDAFWVHENGRLSLYESFSVVSNQLRKIADDTRKESGLYTVIFLVFELLLAVCMLLASLPSLQKADNLHLAVISVFYTIPFKTVAFLQSTTKRNLNMMQHENYPDNKNKMEFKTYEDDDFTRRESHVDIESSFSKKREVMRVMSMKCWFRTKLLLRNGILQRILAFCLVTFLFSTVLQFMVGQTMALDHIVNSAKLTEYVGQLTVSSNTAFIDLMDTFDAGIPSSVTEVNAHLQTKLHGNYTVESIEDTYLKVMADIDDFSMYLNLFRVGDDDMGISYNYIDSVDMMGAYTILLEDGCVAASPSDCSTYYGGIFTRGTYSVVQAYCGDIGYVVNVIYNDYYDADFETRWAAFSDLAVKIVQLNQVYLAPSLEAMEEAVVSYYEDELAVFAQVRIVFLSIWIVFSLFYFVFIMRRAVIWHEKKKTLVREMLLLLPYSVVKSSTELQVALNSLNLS